MAVPVNCMNLTAVYVVPAIVGPLTCAATVKFWQKWVAFGYNTINAGLFGLAQSLIAGALHNNIKWTGSREGDFIFSHIVAGISVYALTALAFKVGLVVSCLTLPGAALLILANTAASLIGMLVTDAVEKRLSTKSQTNP